MSRTSKPLDNFKYYKWVVVEWLFKTLFRDKYDLINYIYDLNWSLAQRNLKLSQQVTNLKNNKTYYETTPYKPSNFGNN